MVIILFLHCLFYKVYEKLHKLEIDRSRDDFLTLVYEEKDTDDIIVNNFNTIDHIIANRYLMKGKKDFDYLNDDFDYNDDSDYNVDSERKQSKLKKKRRIGDGDNYYDVLFSDATHLDG